MLQQLRLKPIAIKHTGLLPPILAPLLAAAELGTDLTPVMQGIAHDLGFDSVMHGISLSVRPNADTSSFVFTTLPVEWVSIYDQRAYIEVDPRVQVGIESTLPFVWDQTGLRGRGPRLDEFLETASAYGVASGVSIPIRDSRARGAIFALNSAIGRYDDARTALISGNLGDIMLVGHYFHELVLSAILEQQIPPMAAGQPLSPRERQCLEMAARGLTSGDIGIKLGITERTAYYHFSNIISKLGVLNRQEAIAKAITQGIIQVKR
jgi:DNA-binding CsgD family transcriptional regulator